MDRDERCTTSRIIRGREVEGEILSWKDGKISFDAHLYLPDTVAELGSLLKETRTPDDAVCAKADKVDPVYPPVPGGEGPSRICREPWKQTFHDGAGLCSPGRWDPSQALL